MRLTAVLAASAAVLIAVATSWAATISKAATTASYRLSLDVGPVEPMYTPAQVKAKHLTSGEVMVGGAMMAGSMMSGAVERHLELHVYSRKTGAVVGNVTPTIALTDETAHAKPLKLEVVAMEGIGQGRADLHYGNNVSVDVGHTYKVAVVVGGEPATFSFEAA